MIEVSERAAAVLREALGTAPSPGNKVRLSFDPGG
jgi:Fe-S cluster assembly iron-binding protein IscA